MNSSIEPNETNTEQFLGVLPIDIRLLRFTLPRQYTILVKSPASVPTFQSQQSPSTLSILNTMTLATLPFLLFLPYLIFTLSLYIST